jgi:hypothetical protein
LFIYDFIDDGANGAEREQNFGLLRPDLSPKMSFAAYAQAAGLLRGCRYARSPSFGERSLANAMLCSTGADAGWLVLWTAEFKPNGRAAAAADVRYERDARTQTTVAVTGIVDDVQRRGRVDCREWDGRPCTVARDAIGIANLPIYLRVDGGLSRIAIAENPSL